MRRVLTLATLTLLAAACTSEEQPADTMAADTGAMTAMDDPDMTPGGAAGVPAGYMGRVDRENQKLEDARYTAMADGRWEVVTGPHHIVWQPGDTASGQYTAQVTLEQMESPTHPESFGIFIGGSDLQGAGQKYGYFMVRGTGDFLVKTRDGANTGNVIGWRASPAVPRADASGKASYDLQVQVGADSVRFSVNGSPVAAVAKSAMPTDGVVGVRIGHNLHVATSRVAIRSN